MSQYKIAARAGVALAQYMISVMTDMSEDNTQARRDAFAYALARHLEVMAGFRPGKLVSPTPSEPTERRRPLGKKKAAEKASVTAAEGTEWEELMAPSRRSNVTPINGSRTVAPDDNDDNDTGSPPEADAPE